ncbi:hypothetical protein ACWOEA_20250, partial [Enterococcus malodoratus]
DTLTIADWGSFCTPKGCGKRKEEPCVNKLLIEFQKFYELFRYLFVNNSYRRHYITGRLPVCDFFSSISISRKPCNKFEGHL